MCLFYKREFASIRVWINDHILFKTLIFAWPLKAVSSTCFFICFHYIDGKGTHTLRMHIYVWHKMIHWKRDAATAVWYLSYELFKLGLCITGTWAALTSPSPGNSCRTILRQISIPYNYNYNCNYNYHATYRYNYILHCLNQLLDENKLLFMSYSLCPISTFS